MSKIEPLTPILSTYSSTSKLNAHLDKIEAAFQNTLSRDGSAPNEMEADINMNDNQLINLGVPALPHSAATKEYVDELVFGESGNSVLSTVGDASLVTVLAAGSTTPRTLATRFSERFNVKDYGALGDDVTDDSAAITAAIAACVAAGRGTLYFPNGTYRMKNIRSPGRVHWLGESFANVVFKYPTTWTAADYMFYNTGGGNFVDFDISWKNIWVDCENYGNGLVQTNFNSALNFGYITRLHLENVLVYRASYIGIAIAACRQTTLDNVKTIGCGFAGSTLSSVALSIGSPCVVTKANHGLPENQAFRFTTTGALPTGVNTTSAYYAKPLTADTFEFSATGGYLPVGVSVNSSGVQSGVHSVVTHSANGGPALWISNSVTNQTEDVTINNYQAESNFWTGLHTNGYNITVNGGHILGCREAGVFSPHAPSSNIYTVGLVINGLTVDGITESDISGSAFELGGEDITVTGCSIKNIDHGCVAIQDGRNVIITGNSFYNFNRDSKGSSPQGCGVTLIGSAIPSETNNIVITGNWFGDEAGTPLGWAPIGIGGAGDDVTDVVITGNVAQNISWVGATTLVTTNAGARVVASNNVGIRNYPFQGPTVQLFTASGTYTPPANLKAVIVEVIGGGGSGGGASAAASQAAAGVGGAGGGYSKKYILASALGVTETVTVGVGGTAPAAGNNNGNPGDASSFGSHLSATGGLGGLTTSTAAVAGASGVLPGLGASGNLNLRGLGSPPVTARFSDGFSIGGMSGSSLYSGNRVGSLTTTSAAGNTGFVYGGGGSGGASYNSGGAVAGGAGAAGVVIVTEFYT